MLITDDYKVRKVYPNFCTLFRSFCFNIVNKLGRVVREHYSGAQMFLRFIS